MLAPAGLRREQPIAGRRWPGRVGAAYYTGNCHKWVCAPKGAAFLHARRDRRDRIRPTVISHGMNSPRSDRSRFALEFDWVGTDDPTPQLCVPAALRFMASLDPGGWPGVMARNREKVLAARRLPCARLDIAKPCPEAMIGSLAAVPLPDGPPGAPKTPLHADPLQDALFEQFAVEVPIVPWPAPPKRLVRVSAQLYNRAGDYERLADALGVLLRR